MSVVVAVVGVTLTQRINLLRRQRRDEIERLWAEGRTAAEIGAAVGMSASAVHAFKSNFLPHLPLRKAGRRPKRKDAA